MENSIQPTVAMPQARALESGQLSRRKFLGMGTAVLAIAGMTRGLLAADRNGSTPGPANAPLDAENTDAAFPPGTDAGGYPTFKYPFAFANKRMHEGGWSREVTVRELPVSKAMAGVNMRLTAGGVRELHWHTAGEWAIMLYGTARITVIDGDGKSFVADVAKNDLWYFPSGMPHSIQGLGPDGAEFLLVFDDGNFSEFGTVLLSDTMRHTPTGVLAKNFGLPASAFRNIPQKELFIFQADVPGALAADQTAAAGALGASPLDFAFRAQDQAVTKSTRGGEVRIVDSGKFKVSTTTAMAMVTIRPGGLRELHWHPNSDEWQYYISGRGRMTIMASGSRARTMDFQAGDVGYVEKTLGHYVENTGDTDLVFLEMFKSSTYQDFSLSEWLAHTPPELVMAHLNIDRTTYDTISKDKPVITPA
ncbi:MAG: bicupin, oxalate decarboxylase family [Lacunisphaera sp.]|nr:bicupin, oxalate decarboxylase family [Lacunisphaera sp.]